MHKLNIIAFGPDSFLSTLNELKPFLKFNLSVDKNLPSEKKLNAFDIFICHFSSLDDQKIEENEDSKSNPVPSIAISKNININT